MGIFKSNTTDGQQRGFYPYTIETEPSYNSNGPTNLNNTAYIYPRYNSTTDADNFSFSASGDYAPTAYDNNSAYADFTVEYTGNANWYTNLYGHGGTSNQLAHPGASNSAARGNYNMYNPTGVSIWMSLSVGTAPHPGGSDAITYMAILRNSMGSYQGSSFWNAPSNVATYTSPRTLLSGCDKIKISGQSYGTHNYRDWVCIASYLNGTVPMNATTYRIINIGSKNTDRSRLAIYGWKILYHIAPVNNYYSSYDP